MRRETFCEILGDLDARYVQEAGSARGAGRSRRLKWGAAAACLCLLLVLPLTAFAVDTLQYNAAVEYLTSLGIPAADLRGYSRSEVKEAARTIDAGEHTPLTESLLDCSSGSGGTAAAPAQVTSDQVRALTPAMTREEVLSLLGDTQDLGSGIYVYVYEVDQQYLLRIPFAGDDAQLGVTGEDLLRALTPISEDPASGHG